jgi:tripartite-type tricarboxylate transporter receptor subunit TctC
MLNVMGGVQATHVPYKGAVALNDLLAGDQVQFMFATIPSVIQHVRSGRLRALAVTSLTRSAAVPEVPAVAEFGFPEFEASSWMGLFGPRDLPREIVDKISTEVARIVRTPDIRERLTQQGADPAGTGPDEFAAYVRAETTRWARVVRTSGAKPE